MGKEGAIAKTLPKKKGAKDAEETKVEATEEPEKPKVDESID